VEAPPLPPLVPEAPVDPPVELVPALPLEAPLVPALGQPALPEVAQNGALPPPGTGTMHAAKGRRSPSGRRRI
jgi:hypothetical protein